MRHVVGVICEYDPFHLGHRRQFHLIRERLPDARIVCLMSGPFTQRGMPALHLPAARAFAALQAGADLVLEMPCAFSVSDAERFALGGVSLLSRLGFIQYLSFGMEDEMSALLPAAALLEAPTPAFQAALAGALAAGLSFPAAQGRALAACLDAPPNARPGPRQTAAEPQARPRSPAPLAWEKPNNILALCYLRAIRRLNSPLIPLPVRREGDYHAPSLQPRAWPSATAVRAAFLAGDFGAAREACGYELPSSPVCRPDALDKVLLYKLRTAAPEALAALPHAGEGLENRLKACAARAATRAELIELLKTRRYARARLSRLCCHALLDMPARLYDSRPLPGYARLLGLRRGAGDLTARLRASGVPILSRAGDGDPSDPLYQLDLRAYDLWALGAGLPQGLMRGQGVRVV